MITSEGLEQLGFNPKTDFVLQDNADGALMADGSREPNVFIAKWNSASPQPTVQEIETAHGLWETEQTAAQYQRDRAAAYASIGDQLDMQYWDALNGTTTWPDHVKEIKKRFPK